MEEELLPVPKHVSLILDGNGRWAKQKNMPRTYGHMMGAKRVEPIIKAADKMGIRYLSMYAFSTENWNRPKEDEPISKVYENLSETIPSGEYALHHLGR